MKRMYKILAIFVVMVLSVSPYMANPSIQKVFAQEVVGDEATSREMKEETGKDEYGEKEDEEKKEDLLEENFQEKKEKEDHGNLADKEELNIDVDTMPNLKEDGLTNYDEQMADVPLSNNIEETTVNLYFVDDAYKDKLSLPSECKNMYQIVLPDGINGNVQYRIQGDSVKVDENGIVSPEITIWYHSPNGYWTTQYIEGVATRNEYTSGESTVTVTCGAYTQSITVNVLSYTKIYVSDTLDKIYNDITSGKTLTEVELAQAFTYYAADHYSYSTSHSSLTGIIIDGAGDCWANTAFIDALCEKAGIEARIRYAANDPGAGSGHRNNIIRIDGKYYIADAGYVGNAPRFRSFYEEPGGLYMQGNTLVQYDAFDEEVVIPEIVGRTEIKVLRNCMNDREQSVFGYGVDVISVSLPKTITDISALAFQGCDTIERILVDDKNPNYMSIDGILYTRDGKVVRVPQNMTNVLLADNTTAINEYAFSQNKASEIIIPDGVVTIGFAAFWNSGANVITVPESVTRIEDHAFETTKEVTIKGIRGSYAEQYAIEQGLRFIDMKSGDINVDGDINLLDLMLCLNHVSKKKMLEGTAFSAADIDGNGEVNLSDLMRILNYVSKKSSSL